MDKKKEELKKLYALRAGLSIISQNSDELENDKNELLKMREEVAQLKKPEYQGKTKKDVDKEIKEQDESADHSLRAMSGRLISLCDGFSKDKEGLHFPILRFCVEKIHDFVMDLADGFIIDSAGVSLAIVVIGHVLPVGVYIACIVLDILTFPFRALSSSRRKAKKMLKLIENDENYSKVSQLADKTKGRYLEPEEVTKLVNALKELGIEFNSLDETLMNKYNMNLSPSTIIHIQEIYGQAAENNRESGYQEVEEQKEEYKKQCEEFKEYQKERQSQYNEREKRSSQLAFALSKESQAITDLLKNSYSSMLSMRDWENLDLVIYYYETGRADSVKEALQLVDNEKRNDNLKDSMEQANDVISSGIKETFVELGDSFLKELKSLAGKMEEQRVKIIRGMSSVSKSDIDIEPEGNADDLSREFTQEELMNILIEKADVSSKDLVEKMKDLNSKI